MPITTNAFNYWGTHAGLFAGIGGFELAAQRAGLKTTWVSEVDSYKKQLLRHHFPNTFVYGNICKLTNPPPVDVLTGGFPCQDISVAGAMRGIVGPQSRLWCEYYRIITSCRPKYIVIENSPNLRNKGLDIILYDLAQAGYHAQWQCLQACQFGYPHQRKRLYLVAYTLQGRWAKKRHVPLFKKIDEVIGGPPRPVILPVPIKRFHPRGNNSYLHGNNGLSTGLDKRAIAAIGDAVVVDVAHYVFECIKIFDEETT